MSDRENVLVTDYVFSGRVAFMDSMYIDAMNLVQSHSHVHTLVYSVAGKGGVV